MEKHWQQQLAGSGQVRPRSSVPHPASLLNQLKQQLVKKPDGAEMSRLIEAHPLLLWGGIWVTVLLVAVIALSGLLSPSFPGGRKASGAAFGTNEGSQVETATGKGQVSIWLFGAIAASCTAGSILVSKRMTRPKRLRRLARTERPIGYATGRYRSNQGQKRGHKASTPQRLKPFTEAEVSSLAALQSRLASQQMDSVPALTQQATRQKLTKVSPSINRRNPKVRSPQSSSVRKGNPRTANPRTANPKSRSTAEVSVAIVPAEQKHSLDWGEASLADMVDIRKRRSLSSWM